MSAERSTPTKSDDWIASFGAWMFSTGFLGGFFIGAVIARFLW